MAGISGLSAADNTDFHHDYMRRSSKNDMRKMVSLPYQKGNFMS
jgi:hypothetical protein